MRDSIIEALSLIRALPISATSSNLDLRGVVRRGGGVNEWVWKGGKRKSAIIEMAVNNPKGKQPLRHGLLFRGDGQGFRLEDEHIQERSDKRGRVRFLLLVQADSKELQIRCRAGFRKLLEKCDYERRMPRLSACGSRDTAFADFKIDLAEKGAGHYVALWIDSEDPLTNLEAAWAHLSRRDKWKQPTGATDDQVLFMTT
jgi:hypothetical protein